MKPHFSQPLRKSRPLPRVCCTRSKQRPRPKIARKKPRRPKPAPPNATTDRKSREISRKGAPLLADVARSGVLPRVLEAEKWRYRTLQKRLLKRFSRKLPKHVDSNADPLSSEKPRPACLGIASMLISTSCSGPHQPLDPIGSEKLCRGQGFLHA